MEFQNLAFAYESRQTAWQDLMVSDAARSEIENLVEATPPTAASVQRLEQTVQRQAEELAAVNAILAHMITVQDLPTLLQIITEQAIRLTKGTGGGIYLTDPERQEVRCAVSYRTKRDFAGTLLKYGEGVAGQVAQTQQPLRIDNYRTWPGRAQVYETEQPFRAVIGAPVIWNNQVTGVLTVLHEQEGMVFSPEDLDLLLLFANQAAIAIENARRFAAERDQLAFTQTIQELSGLLTSQISLEQVLETILDLTARTIPCDSISIQLIDENGMLDLAAGRGFASLELARQTARQTSALSIKNRWADHEVIIIPDTHADSRWVVTPDSAYIRSWIGAPLLVKGRFIGCLNVDSRTVNAFNRVAGERILAFANQAAVAIQNARLFQQAATERRHLSLLFDLSREIVSTLDPDEILSRAAALTCQVLGGLVGEAFLYVPEEQRLSLRALYGLQPDTVHDVDRALNLRLGAGLAGWVAAAREPVFIPEVGQDPRWVYVPKIDRNAHAAIAAPILAGERLLGVLTVIHETPGAFTPDHLALMEAICQEVALALSNASRYEQVQRRLTEITLIQNLTQTFNKRLELQVLLDEVVRQLVDRLGYFQVEIFFLEDQVLYLRAYHGVDPKMDRLPVEQGIIGRVARTGQAALIPDVSQDPDYFACIPGTVAELTTPIFRGEQVVGVINIQSDQPGKLGVQDLELIQVLAGQISIALENAVLYESVRRHAEDLEQEVDQRTAELTGLYQLSQEIGYSLSYESLLHLLLRRLQSAMHSDLAAGCLTTGDRAAVTVQAARPLSKEAIEALKGLGARSFQQFAGLGPDPAALPLEWMPFDPSLAELPKIRGVGSALVAPIFAGDRFAGFLVAASERTGAFGPQQERFLTTLANQAANAFQRLEAMLAAQQKHLESLVQHLPVGTLLFDSNYNLLVANSLGREILGLLSAENEPGGAIRLGPYLIQELVRQQNESRPVEIVLEGSPRRIFEAQVRPVSDPGGSEQMQWVLMVREVTQERENQARITGQERLATVGQLAAGIAHDFNNIMAAILVYTDLLRSDPNLPGTSREKLAIIQQQVQRASSLIRQILDFSRRSVMDQSPLDLLPFIKELDKMLARVLPETIHLELTYQPASYWVKADPTRLQQVFMNLALNARDAMPEGGSLRFILNRVTLASTQAPPIPDMPSGEWICVSVIDTGSGISAEARNHIFEPFFTTKPVGEGTGLGLAQVYGIIRQHEGFIDVKSRPGEGAAFEIYLPALPAAQNAPAAAEPSQWLKGNQETILVVEDDQGTREALQALLEAQDFRVLTATNGVEALTLIEEQAGKIALIISDVVMPAMGGVALYLMVQEQHPEIQMLLVTGHPLDERNQSLLEKGQLRWLQKPFSVKEFNRMLRAALQKTPGTAGL